MRTVVAPIGGAGNHVRWLCLLDEDFDLSDVTKTKADNCNFILNTVYNKKRDWKNWLKIEYLWRETVDKEIKLKHVFETSNNEQVLHVNVSAQKCFEHYSKFYHGRPIEKFMQDYQQAQNTEPKIGQVLTIDFEKYYKNDIDVALIGEINNFFSIHIPFENAFRVHQRWLDLLGEKK
jgi:hypothetical protein